jgi:predicted nucleic acid-binding protein
MKLEQIDAAIAKQRTTIGRIKVELERTDIRDMQAVRSLRADLEQARLIAIRLDQLRRQNARRFAANVRPIIDEIIAAGATSHNAIAAKLNERNVRTARGGADACAGGGDPSPFRRRKRRRWSSRCAKGALISKISPAAPFKTIEVCPKGPANPSVLG